MAEYGASAVQTVMSGGNILFSETIVKGVRCIQHREGSGIITLRGLTNQCRARFRVSFNGNISSVGAVNPISVAIAISGEALPAATMIVTPAAIGDYFSVAGSTFIDVPAGCCVTISVLNTSNQTATLTTQQSITVRDANIIVERVA